MSIWMILLFLLGLVVIIKGGDWFVEAAVWVAEVTGVPKMLIGATVVSLATTLPEFFVSVIAVADGATQLGIGNALGSIICNTGLILALSIVIRPVTVEKQLFYKKAGLMLLALILLYVSSLDKVLSATESIPLFAILAIFIYLNVHHVKKSNLERQKQVRHIDTDSRSIRINIIKFIVGAAGIVIGAKMLVESGTNIAADLGVAQGIIGVTIVAIGTSLPELVTTITALKKNESSLGIGNILGANILNFTMILSTCALISKNGLQFGSETLMLFNKIQPRSIYLDMPVVASLFLLLIIPPIFCRGRLKRYQGVLMLAVYILFILILILNAIK